ncbi:MAG: hypothetical protein JWM87_708 [Candidatus Eremiobacteraeota bacterium]|nr:hypothetical protein [Candidatus Eremiobacteraeota bacterium]
MSDHRARDATRLSDFAPDELDAIERGLVAVAYEIGERGTLTMSVSRGRICDWAALIPVRGARDSDGLRRRLDAWREVHVPAGANVVDGLLRVLAPDPR